MPMLNNIVVFTAVFACAQSLSFLSVGLISNDDVTAALSAVSSRASVKRIAELEEAMKPTFTAMPKNRHGRLSRQAGRYMLHRFFVQRYGWFVRGLEPNRAAWHGIRADQVNNASTIAGRLHEVKEWIPNYLQELLENKLNLHGMALFAAVLEDLVKQEVVGRLNAVFEIHELPTSQPVEIEDVDELMHTYFLSWLTNGNMSAGSPAEMKRLKANFAKRYMGYQEVHNWLVDLEEQNYEPENGDRHTFQSTMNVATLLGQSYHSFNQLDCRALKNELRSMELFKPGRVRLSTFYNKQLFSHWGFNEKADYLRTLGVLDDADAAQPEIITSNYIMARPNCLEPSKLYAICCRNECEDLMSYIEREVKTSTASPHHIAQLVAALPSDTVDAPRELSPTLLGHLRSAANSNGGQVPLHGRLFAQWMHHAYPRECPYPHETGTTSPQTAEEWMQETGQTESSASSEEMQAQIKSDLCIGADGKVTACSEVEAGGSELPWSEREELLLSEPEPISSHNTQVAAGEWSWRVEALLGVSCAMASAVLVTLIYRMSMRKHSVSAAATHPLNPEV